MQPHEQARHKWLCVRHHSKAERKAVDAPMICSDQHTYLTPDQCEWCHRIHEQAEVRQHAALEVLSSGDQAAMQQHSNTLVACLHRTCMRL